MKILYADDSRHQSAWYFARKSFCKAFVGCGHEVILWDIYSKPAFDIFDEFQPDIFIGQSYNLERGVIQSIIQRPNLRVILKGSDWSKFSDNIDSNKYPILKANKKEIKLVEELNSKHKIDFIFGHYHPNKINITHEYWANLGIPIRGIPLAADITEWTNGQYNEDFSSDIAYNGGNWAYKGLTLNTWLVPLCTNLSLNIKIFGNKPWSVPQYCGYLPDSLAKHVMKSAKVCPNVHELHSQDFGIDINERSFKLMSNKCPMVCDYVETLEKDFFIDKEIEFAKNSQEFQEKVLAVIHGDLVIDTNKSYNSVMDKHTYFHRAVSLFEYLSLEQEKENCLSKYTEIRKANCL
jgi:hypothetical protein